jgi:hypothetical protein
MIADKTKVARNISALALLVVAAAGCYGGSGADTDDGSLQIRSDLYAGDLVDQDGVRVIVPEPGSGIFAEVIALDGSMSTLNLETTLDGIVVEHVVGPVDDLPPLISASPPACSDAAYNLASYRWNEVLHWRFKASTTPDYLDATAVEEAVRKGTTNITTSYNSCGLADEVSATQHYDGQTSVGPNILSDATCGTGDGLNVVAFGSLPDAVLGVACTWYLGGVAVEADIRLNRGDHPWYTSKPSTCSNRYDIQSVMTHERGHSFGLAHVSESAHANLTMSQALGPCDNSARTLGLGDVKALRQKY